MGELITAFTLILSGGLLSFIEKYRDNKKERKTNLYNYIGFVLIFIGAVIGLSNGCSAKKNKDIADKKIDSVNSILTTKQTTIDSITKVLDFKQDRLTAVQAMNFDTARAILAQSLELNKAQDENNRKQNEIILIQNQNLNTTKAILSQSTALNKSQIENNKKQEQLLKEQSQVFKEITGSNNNPKLFCVPFRTSKQDTSYYISIGLRNLGNYPINGCYLDIQELYQIDTFNTISKRFKTPTHNLAKISNTYFYETRVPFLKVGKFYSYMVQIHWDRGSYHGILKIYDIIDEKYEPNLKYELTFLSESGSPLPENYFNIND